VLQGDWTGARPRLELAIAAARDARQPIPLAHSLTMASIAASMAGDRASAGRFLDEAQAVAADADDVAATVGILQARALKGAIEGDFETVKLVATEGARLSREAGDLYALHMMLLNLGGAALAAGDLTESKRRQEEALRIAYRIDDRIGQFYLLAALAYHATISGQPRVAAQLLGASEAMRIGAGATVMAVLAPFVIQAEESASASLGALKYAADFEIGGRLSRDAAVRLALGESRAVAAAPDHAGAGVLGKRQADVARLVADGLTNKQIGARLFISERTVDSHVRNILDKLGFNTRAQIAGWVASSNR
jgi:DNA-binding CsgD family transcriptional regulator